MWRTLRFRPWVDGRVQRSCGISASRRANLQPSRAEWRWQEFFRPLLRTKSVVYPPHAYKSVSYDLPCTFIKVLGSILLHPWGFSPHPSHNAPLVLPKTTIDACARAGGMNHVIAWSHGTARAAAGGIRSRELTPCRPGSCQGKK